MTIPLYYRRVFTYLCFVRTRSAGKGGPPAPEKSKKHSAEVDTALHVIKGAIVTVLGPTAVLTTSVGFESPSKYVRWECRSSSCLCAELE